MPMTRAKATSLLNQKEMSLYDDSRVNTLRQLDAKALSTRITRARASRDRARDLVQRQKLASRDRTGNKRGTSGAANQRSKDKAALMADILKRFEDQLKQAERADRKAAKAATRTAKTAKTATRRKTASQTRATARRATREAVAGTASARKSTRKATKRTAAGDAAGGAKRATARTDATRAPTKAAGKTSATKTTKKAAKKVAKKVAKRADGTVRPRGKRASAGKRALTPAQALENTRKLLEEKQARDREPKAWEQAGQTEAAEGQPGFQSGAAARRAERLHAAEARLPAIQGSISTRDRINQGKRDHRRAPGGED